jgi:hypothetical protein
MGPSERLVRFEKTLLLETKVEGMKANAIGRINSLKEEATPFPKSAQSFDPKETEETANVDHEYEKQILDYLARHSLKESAEEPHSDSHKDQEDKVEEFINAALNKRKFSNAAKKKLEPFTRVINKTLRSSHSSYPEHKFGPKVEIVKAVRDLVFLDSERSIGYEGTTLLSETRAKGTKLLAAEIEPKKRSSLDEKRDPGVEIDEGYEVNDQDIAMRDLFFLDWCEGYALRHEMHAEGTKLLAFETEPLDHERDPDVDIDEGREEDEHRQPARDLALLDLENTEYEEKSLAAEPHAKGSELLAFENDPLGETRDPPAYIDEMNEQGQRELDLVSQLSESIAYDGNALAAEMHAKRTLNNESRTRHSGGSADSDEAYEVNELELAFLDLLVESHDTATKLLAVGIESRKKKSLDEIEDPGVDVDAGYEVDTNGAVFLDDCESAITFSSDKAAATEALPNVPTSDENKIDRNLTAMFEEDKELVPASKKLLPLYYVLKAMIVAHQDHQGSVSSPRMVDAFQRGAPLEVMQDLQEWASKCFSPK